MTSKLNHELDDMEAYLNNLVANKTTSSADIEIVITDSTAPNTSRSINQNDVIKNEKN